MSDRLTDERLAEIRQRDIPGSVIVASGLAQSREHAVLIPFERSPEWFA